MDQGTSTPSFYRSRAVPQEKVWIGTSQGDCDYKYDNAMPREDYDLLDAARCGRGRDPCERLSG